MAETARGGGEIGQTFLLVKISGKRVRTILHYRKLQWPRETWSHNRQVQHGKRFDCNCKRFKHNLVSDSIITVSDSNTTVSNSNTAVRDSLTTVNNSMPTESNLIPTVYVSDSKLRFNPSDTVQQEIFYRVQNFAVFTDTCRLAATK